MHLALIANRFFCSEGAFLNPFPGIIKKSGAVVAQILCRAMVGTTIDMDHGFNRPDFKIHTTVSS